MNLLRNPSLLPFHTFGIEVSCRALALIQSEADLTEALEWAQRESLPVLILGGGSNVLFLEDFPGLILVNRQMGYSVESFGSKAWVRVGGGEVWHEVVQRTVEAGLGGIENLSLIPGTAGAAPIQNIGAYGVELKDVFHSLRAVSLFTGEVRVFSLEDCRFGYRDSVFKQEEKGKWWISEITLGVSSDAPVRTQYGAIREELAKAGVQNPRYQDVAEAVVRIRTSKLPDPKVVGNAGSFFKNPEMGVGPFEALLGAYPGMPSYPAGEGKVKVPAGWLIEQAGWKGHRRGTHGVHPLQALVLVNYGGATGREIWRLSEDIVASVKARFGVELEREVNAVGRPG